MASGDNISQNGLQRQAALRDLRITVSACVSRTNIGRDKISARILSAIRQR